MKTMRALLILLAGLLSGRSQPFAGAQGGSGAGLFFPNSAPGTKLLLVSQNSGRGSRLGLSAVPLGTTFGTLQAAASNALPGDTIIVDGGNFTNTGNLLRPGVNWNFVSYTTISNFDSGTGDGEGVFDDRYIGATTNVISGLLDVTMNAGTNFYFAGGASSQPTGAGNPNCHGVFVVTNALSRMTVNIGNVGWTYYAGLQANGAIYAYDGTNDFTFISIADPADHGLIHWSAPDPIDDADLAPNSAGIWWGKGETYVHAGSINASGYGIYSSEPPAYAPVTANLWVTVDHLMAKFYAAATPNSPNYRTWIVAKWIEVNAAPAVTVFGGKEYILAQKISTLSANQNNVIESTAGAEIWVTAQKMSVSNALWGKTYSSGGSVGKMWLDCEQFEDLGKFSGGAGFQCSAGEMNVRGASATKTNSPVILVDGGKATFRDLNLKSQSNCVAFITGGTLNFQNCTLIAATNAISGGPAATNAISARSAQTVGIYGHNMSNRTNHPNITMSPLGAFTVDANVK